MTCIVCGDEITPPERAEIKNYCKKPECVRQAMPRREIAVVNIGKALVVQAIEDARRTAANGGFMDGRRKV